MNVKLRSSVVALVAMGSFWACSVEEQSPETKSEDDSPGGGGRSVDSGSGGASERDRPPPEWGTTGGMGGMGGAPAGAGGSPVVSCDSDEQDHDEDGVCEATCEAAALECGLNEECEDSSGSAECVCAFGFQDADGNGSCEAGCAEDTCSGNGVCSDLTGSVVCACDDDHQGEDCSLCAEGAQDMDADGHCTATCENAEISCEANEQCSHESGTVTCVCVTGFQDEDEDGTCSESCELAVCGDNTVCSHETGVAVCSCEEGYEGPDGEGDCFETCASTGLLCADNSHCEDDNQIAECLCDSGYQDNDNNSECLENCATASLSCGSNAACSDESGTPDCVCEDGYGAMDEGGDCSSCIEGVLTLAEAAVGSTVGNADSNHGSCGSIFRAPDATYSFTAGEKSSYQFSTGGTSYDTVLSVHDPAGCSGEELACNDDGPEGGGSSRLSILLEAGQQVNVAVNAWGANVAGDYRLEVVKDPCEDAVDLGSNLGDSLGSFTADVAVDYRSQCGTPALAPEHYFKWTAPETKSYTFNTTGSDYDTVLYTLETCDMSEYALTCNDDGGTGFLSQTTREMVAGETLIFVVDAWGAALGGTSVLNINETP